MTEVLDAATINERVKSRLMLTRLTIRKWGWHKVDRAATEKVETEFAAAKGSGKYNKLLLPRAAIEPIIKADGAARTTFYKYTRPYADDGYRIATTEGYFELLEQMGTRQGEFDAAVRDLVNNLDAWKAEAKLLRGALYNEEDYPDASKLRDAFSMDVSIMPMPTGGDCRFDLDEVTLGELRSDVDKRVHAAVEEAMKDAYREVIETVGHMAEKLAISGTIYRDSLVNNVKDLQRRLPLLDMTGDQRLPLLVDDLAELTQSSADELRNSNAERARVAAKAARIKRMVEGWV